MFLIVTGIDRNISFIYAVSVISLLYQKKCCSVKELQYENGINYGFLRS